MATVQQSDSTGTDKGPASSEAIPARQEATPIDGSSSQAEPSSKAKVDFDDAEFYLNRELTWLAFNRRVLSMADNPVTPLLERVKFLAIISSNIDEFQMKRIGGLKQQVAAGVRQVSVDGRTPAKQIIECQETVRDLHKEQNRILRKVLSELAQQGIQIVKYQSLTEAQKETQRRNFIENIFPLLTPLAMDPGHPFPFISNLALNLLVTLRHKGGTIPHIARVKVPVTKGIAPRFVRVDENYTFVALDDVVMNNLDLLFPGMKIVSCELFRVTRNAVVESDEEEADDLLQMIESELRHRHFAPIVRLQIAKGMDPVHRGMLAAELGLDEANDVYEVEAIMAMRDLFEIASLDIPELHDPPFKPIDHPRLAHDTRNIFHIIRERGSLLLQHPYESFTTSVERFLQTASTDPKVLAIKMTLYRTSAEGGIIDALTTAARHGKQVAVLVELKARFDEAANIGWARRLEQSGIHVTYGVVGLKTHSKVILVVRKDYNKLRRYAHIGTGNYHAGTARMYSDLGMFTCDEQIAQDLTELFNYLTGYSPPPTYRKILAAPYTLKRSLLQKIEREQLLHSEASPGHIQFKMNALEDVDITRALYKAAQAGVKIDLIVRDTCRMRAGIPGLSDTVRIISVIGRFLEHARIYYFQNGGDEEYYIGSADLMTRNLESRVEVVAPVDDERLRQELRLILDIQLSSKKDVWEMHQDGSYAPKPKPAGGEPTRNSQETFIALAQKRKAAAAKHRQSKLRAKLLTYFHKRVLNEG